MSGRVRVKLADGRVVTGFRKTLARRRRLDPAERVKRAHERCTKRFQSKWVRDVRVGFLLPNSLQPFVTSGPHGHNINVVHGFVQIMHGSAEECFVSAKHFFADVARDREPFTVLACITSKDIPGRCYWRSLSVAMNGGMVVWEPPRSSRKSTQRSGWECDGTAEERRRAVSIGKTQAQHRGDDADRIRAVE